MRITIALPFACVLVGLTVSPALAQNRGSVISGFKDPAGNIWLQDHRGRSGVILNMDDDPEPQQETRKPNFKFMEPDSQGMVKLR